MPVEVFGSNRADTLIGGDADNFLYPRAIFDEPPSSTAIDVVFGGLGNDLLYLDCQSETQSVYLGTAGNPRFILTSESGNFYVQGAPDIERVTILGGSGNDTFQTANYAAAVFGGAGIDHWIGNYAEATQNVYLHLDNTHVVRNIGLLDFFGIERLSLTTGSGNDNIAGGAYVDYISTGAGRDSLNAGAKPVGSWEEVDGGDGIDTLVVDAADDSLGLTLGVAGAPRFILTSVSDRYGVSAYNVERVSFRGGAGNDVITTANMAVLVDGRGGIDLWRADYRDADVAIDLFMKGQPTLEEVGVLGIGGIERLDFVAGQKNDTIFAGDHADRIDGAAGNDIIDMGARDPTRPEGEYDVAIGGAGRDLLIVDASLETTAVFLTAGALSYSVTSVSGRFHVEASEFERIDMKTGTGADRLEGATNADTLAGGGGNDTLIGGGGRDSLDGGRGNDLVMGGLGQDDLTGNAGRDIFVFTSIAESTASLPDKIHDFLTRTDRLDLSAIDANGTLPGDGVFDYIGNQQFHHIAGELRSDFATVQGDINGDGIADFQIDFANGGPTRAGDVIL